METQLATVPDKQLADTSTGALIGAVLQAGVTSANVDVVERLMALREREESRQAQKDFATAFIDLQGDCKKVKANKVVPNDDGTPRYAFAPFETIMDEVQPLAAKHGFGISFDTEYGDGKIVAICKLTHRSGHSESTRQTCRIGKGPPKASDAQADGAATSYAKRFALCSALNIRIEGMDNDARGSQDGETITPEEALRIEAWVEEVGGIKPAFLKYIGVERFTDIPKSRLPAIESDLRRKGGQKK